MLVVVGVAALGGCRTCIDADVPRQYACTGDAGIGDECPDRYDDKGDLLAVWECNTTWGYCFDTTKGEPHPCRVDSECGGGWRCTPDGRCGDPSQEGALSTIELEALEKLHPLAFEERPDRLEAAAPLRVSDVAGLRTESALAGRVARQDVEVLGVTSLADPDGARFRTTYRRIASPGDDFALTVGVSGQGAQYFLWSLPGQQLRRTTLSSDGGTQTEPNAAPGLNGCTWVAPLRTAGDPVSALIGTVQVRHQNGLALVSPYLGRLDAGVSGSDAREAVLLTPPLCTDAWLVVIARSNGLEAVRITAAGAESLGTVTALNPGDFRIATRGSQSWLAWRSGAMGGNASKLSIAELTGLCVDAGLPEVAELRRPVCPVGDYRAYDLVDTGEGPPELVTECVEFNDAGVELNDVVFIGERRTPAAYLPSRIVTRESAQVFSRFTGGLLTQGPNLVVQEPLSLPSPPEALVPLDGELHAFTARKSFLHEPWGFMIDRVPEWTALPANYVELAGWVIARSGVVIDPQDDGVIALPEDDWADPSSYVLSELLPQSDGGAVLVATHDDAFDVAELGDEQPTLVTRLKPSPATPILSLALQPGRDGGVAEGFVVAGLDLFEVRASTPRRWSATKVPLAGLRPVFTWFDRGWPRALLDDGTVVGLNTRVPLSGTLPEEVRAGGALCGAPFALSATGLWMLLPPAPDAEDPRPQWVQLGLKDTTEETDFTRGRLVTLDDALYVFSNSGGTWKVTPAGGACPSP